MHASASLRAHLEQVQQLRLAHQGTRAADAFMTIRQLQVHRFADTYADFLASERHAPSVRFFLHELYSPEDHSQRDAQFARIASAMERLFPAPVVDTALLLAEVHALTESLDWSLALHWPLGGPPTSVEELASAYLLAWQRTGEHEARERQLSGVMALGERMSRVVRTPGLRTALKFMRAPAQAAGLYALQAMLESGFDAFRSMGETKTFLEAIRQRESDWIDQLLLPPAPQRVMALAQTLTRGRHVAV